MRIFVSSLNSFVSHLGGYPSGVNTEENEASLTFIYGISHINDLPGQ